MKAWTFSLSASPLWKNIAIFLSVACAGIIAANAIETAPATQAAPSAAASTAPKPAASKKPPSRATRSKVTRPYWNDLTPAQRDALAPVAAEWDKLGSFRKKKWLELANRYATMSPEEQSRMQQRMRDWVKLSPEQRREARQSYNRVRKLTPEQRSAQWEHYQQLPEEKKKELAATTHTRKTVANPPLTHVRKKTAAVKKALPAPPKPAVETPVPIQPEAESTASEPDEEAVP
jgi:hypothetical protein